MKRCTRCDRTLPLDQFRWEVRSKDLRKTYCRECANARQREDRKRHGDKRRASDRAAYRRKATDVRRTNMKRFYGLTDAEVARVEQAACCDICKRPGVGRRKQLVVDHCHTTERNRGVLCSSCNAALGQFRDDVAVMRRAADYVEQQGFGFFEEATDEATSECSEGGGRDRRRDPDPMDQTS